MHSRAIPRGLPAFHVARPFALRADVPPANQSDGPQRSRAPRIADDVRGLMTSPRSQVRSGFTSTRDTMTFDRTEVASVIRYQSSTEHQTEFLPRAWRVRESWDPLCNGRSSALGNVTRDQSHSTCSQRIPQILLARALRRAE